MQAVSFGLRRSSDVARARVKSRVQKIVVAGSFDQHDRRSDRFDRFRRSVSRRAIGNKARRSIATCLIINGATVDVSSQEFRSRANFNLLTRQPRRESFVVYDSWPLLDATTASLFVDILFFNVRTLERRRLTSA